MASPTIETLPPNPTVGDNITASAGTSTTQSAADQDRDRQDAKSSFKLTLKTSADQSQESTQSASASASPSTGRRPLQRKLSVFSHNGFQQLDQLDQASLRQHASSHDQTVAQPQQPSPSMAQSGGLVNEAKEPQQQQQQISGDKNGQRPARNDTLGSTGSSRASSCDEPTIVQQQIAASIGGPREPSAAVIEKNRAPCSSSSTLDTNESRRSDNSTSSSSLESIGATQTSEDQKKHHRLSETNVPPFESIKTQLKRNSIPDPEFMRRHIDNVISQNQALFDNWNSVSIRSYNHNSGGNSSNSNSNNTGNFTTGTAAANVSQRRQTTTATITSSNELKQLITTMPASPTTRLQDASSSKRPKRWSTTALGSEQHNASSRIQTLSSAAQSTSSANKQIKFPQQTQFNNLESIKRSFCAPSSSMTPTLEPILQQQQLNFSDHHQRHSLLQHHQQQQLLQREVENLSMRRQQIEAERLLVGQMMQHQQHQPIDLALARPQQQQQEYDMILAAFAERERQHQLESQLLNEYLARMMLNVQVNSSGGTTIMPLTNTPSDTTNSSQTEPELPSHRCEACDISFWTQDLLNYHSITQCSARRGPQLARPLAFNFVGPNNFDSLASQQQHYNHNLNQQPTAQQKLQKERTKSTNFLTVPLNSTSGLLATPSQRHSHHAMMTYHQTSSKSASPPRRPHDQEEAEQNRLDQSVVDNLVAQTKGLEQLFAAGGVTDDIRLSILKQQLIGNGLAGSTTMAFVSEPQNLSTHQQNSQILHNQPPATSLSAANAGSTMLPFKKRKISEPNMRY